MLGTVDRRFVCQQCGTKWFIHAHRHDEPDLTECGSCGGPLMRFADGLGSHSPDAALPDEGAGEPGADG
jgi:hypothetical protein